MEKNMKERMGRYCSELPAGSIAAQLGEAVAAEGARLVVTAEPGAGKSTLLPLVMMQALPDGKILMLEPRRLAARQIADRMAHMLGEKTGETVGCRVRFETKVSARTRVEVITEGILQRMLVEDPFLEGVAAVVFDEFHERSLTADVALALVREAQAQVRPDLRIVIMSATIDASPLCRELDATHLEAPGRLHHVEIVYAPPGGQASPSDATGCLPAVVRKAHAEHTGDILVFLPGQGEIRQCSEALEGSLGDTRICPLYGLLGPEQQRRAIAPSPPGRRKVVLATPIAETSITIEGVTVVVDSGLCRTLRYEPSTGLGRLCTVPISLDMATQRAGRAGRLRDGVCYRLWSKGAEARMAASRRPEIMAADLAGTVLDIAAWGEPDASRLPWLTPPPPGHLAEARRILADLEALDDKGRITEYGRKLSLLPCHPRMAAMLVSADTPELKALAADIAALLEERDPMADSDQADINLRIGKLRRDRARKTPGRYSRIADIAAQYRRLVRAPEVNDDPHPADTGLLIATAYPERVARKSGYGRYRLAGPGIATLPEADSLGGHDLLAVASMDRRIFLASPVRIEDLVPLGRWRDNVSWDARQGRAVAARELRLGSLLLESRPMPGDHRQLVCDAICAAAPRQGLSMFDFSDAVRHLQRRVATLKAWHPEMDIPDLSAQALLDRASDWLPLYIGKASTTAELRKIDMCEVMTGLLPYESRQALERLVPGYIQLPGGRRARVDYRQGAEAPVVSARLQDCLGLLDTPRLDGGRRPVLMELLSPGFKPVQLTSDLRSFWTTTYFDVRKELRRRYPRHRWPDNPLDPAR